MTDSNIYFGAPGALVTLPHPRGDFESTRARPVQGFALGNGESRTRKGLHGTRQFNISWERLDFDTFETLRAFDQGHMGPGPFVVLDPGRRNMLTANQSASTSLSNDATNFTIAGSGCTIGSSVTLTTGVPRSLAWTFNFTSPASASAILSLDSPYAGWPGIPVVASRSMCFSCLMRGGGTDAIVSYAPELLWYDSTGALLSTSTGSTVASSAGAWTSLPVVATAPSTAAYAWCRVHYVSGATAGSIGYFSSFQFEEGTTRGTWRPGTGVLPVTVVGLHEEWPWLYPLDVRKGPALVLREDGA